MKLLLFRTYPTTSVSRSTRSTNGAPRATARPVAESVSMFATARPSGRLA